MTKKNHTELAQEAVGPCPTCGKVPDWFNDVPLRAFCWGSEKKPHEEMTRVVPGAAQPYGKISKSVWKKGSDA